MSYAGILDGVVERLEVVAGLPKYRGATVTNILKYEPRSVHTSPLAYLTLDSLTRETTGQVTAMRYRIRVRVCIKWQDNEGAELEMIPFVNWVPAAFDADRYLGGAIPNGRGGAQVTDAVTGYIDVSGVTHRILDVFLEVVEKAAFQSGI